MVTGGSCRRSLYPPNRSNRTFSETVGHAVLNQVMNQLKGTSYTPIKGNPLKMQAHKVVSVWMPPLGVASIPDSLLTARTYNETKETETMHLHKGDACLQIKKCLQVQPI